MASKTQCAILTGLLVATDLALAGAPPYRLELLEDPAGCQTYSFLSELDEWGHALGVVTCDAFLSQGGVVWTREGLVELPSLGGSTTVPAGINAKGQVVGFAETPEIYADDVYVVRPFLWDGGRLRELGTLGGRVGAALAINARGTIVGACQPTLENPVLGRVPVRACVWEGGDVRDLGDLGGPEAYAYDLNDRGWIVGSADTAEPLGSSFVHHAFLNDGHTMHDLGELGGVFSLAVAVNEHGDAVGWSLTGDTDPNGHTSRRAFLWKDGVLQELESLGGPYSEAADINDRGQIVGWSWVATPNGTFRSRAVLWNRGTITDLNDTVEDRQGWSLTETTAIDDRGWVLANAYRDWEWRMALLIPVASE